MNGRRNLLLAAAWGLAACGAAAATAAASTNLPARTDYAKFGAISDRNIFNPNRYPHHTPTGRVETVRAPTADTIELVGTLSSAKGTFAFFTGPAADFRKVLQREGEIAGFQVAAIQPNAVLLAVSNNVVMEMPVGAQLRRDAEAGWQLLAPATGTQPVERAEAPAAEAAGGDPGDVLKKLMQKREQELQ